MRVALGIEYDGSSYHGWQHQLGLNTIQGHVQRALSRVADHDIRLSCAGRTDTGVHATGQVVHFDTRANRNVRSWTYGANSNLPQNISVLWAKIVEEDFHARFSALARQYRYFIFNNPIRPSLNASGITWQYRPLDDSLMADAAMALVGEHDFTSFRAVGCQSKSPIRRVESLTVKRYGDIIVIDITANGFLHHMVRNIVGVLMTIGAGRQEVSWTEELLEVRNRTLAAETAPPYGLYLVNVTYDQRFELPYLP